MIFATLGAAGIAIFALLHWIGSITPYPRSTTHFISDTPRDLGCIQVEQEGRALFILAAGANRRRVRVRRRSLSAFTRALSVLLRMQPLPATGWVKGAPRRVRVGTNGEKVLIEVDGVAIPLPRLEARVLHARLVKVLRGAKTPKPRTQTGVALSNATAALESVFAILDPDWVRGRVLPRVVGAEDQARIRAIQEVVESALAERYLTAHK